MNIAEKIKEALRGCDCFTLYGGYGMSGGNYVRFPVGHCELEKRNQQGRVIKARYRYEDGSVLSYAYSIGADSIDLVAR